MQNYASATVEGFVTHEPVFKTTKTGKSVCSFSIAINHYSNPESPPKVSYLDIETWEKFAEHCSKNISKGKRVMVIGELRQDRWEGTDGRIQSKIKLVGNHLRLLGSIKAAQEKDVEEKNVEEN
jgi:single-strand DNA-binding protein